MSEYHESVENLSAESVDHARALHSLKEEIEATDWYNQRAAATANASLKTLLIHNRNEEIEHASMLIEWLRRNMDGWEEQLRTYLFTEKNILEVEEEAESEGCEQVTATGSRDLGLGQLYQEGDA